MLAWFIAGGSTAAFMTLWFLMVHRELSHRRHNVERAAGQLGFGQDMLKSNYPASAEASLRQMQDTDTRIYEQSVRGYNAVLLLFQNRFPGWVMGFRVIEEQPGGEEITHRFIEEEKER